MFAEQISAAIAGAYGLAPLQALSSAIWKSYSAGSLSETEAQTLAEQIEARKALAKAAGASPAAPARLRSIFPPRKPQRAPRRPEAIARRRRLASSGPMPPALACRFTVSELAVLKIVSDEHRHHGACDRSLGEIAARAGCCRKTAQNALRLAQRLGLVMVQIRKRRGQKNLTNVVSIVCEEWLSWLDKGPPKHRGNFSAPHGQKDSSERKETAKPSPAFKAMRGRNSPLSRERKALPFFASRP